MYQDVVISENFRKQMEKMNIVDQLQKKCETSAKGQIHKLEDGLYLLKDEKKASKMGEESLAIIRNYTPEKSAEGFIKVIDAASG